MSEEKRESTDEKRESTSDRSGKIRKEFGDSSTKDSSTKDTTKKTSSWGHKPKGDSKPFDPKQPLVLGERRPLIEASAPSVNGDGYQVIPNPPLTSLQPADDDGEEEVTDFHQANQRFKLFDNFNVRTLFTRKPKEEYLTIDHSYDEEINALSALLHDHLTHQEFKFTKKQAALIAASVIISGLSLTLYWGPTREYAGDQWCHQALWVSSVLAANFGVAAFASYEGLKSIFFQNISSPNLRALINPDYAKDRTRDILLDLAYGACAIAAAIPYGFAADDDWIKAVVLATNAFLNYYCIKKLLVEHVKFVWGYFTHSPATKASNKLFAAFTHAVQEIRYQILNEGTVPPDFRRGSNLNPSDMLKALAEYASYYDVQAYVPLSTTQILFRRILPAAAGTALVGSLGIYLLRSYENMSDLPKGLSIPIVGISSIFFFYMAITFGANTVIDFVDYITGNSRPSLARQLYKVPTTALLALVYGAVAFSFGTVANFITTDKYFNNDGELSDYKIFILCWAATGCVIFNSYANHQLVTNLLGSIYQRFFGKKEPAQFGSQMDKFIKNVNGAMSREAFHNSLSALTERESVSAIMAILPLLKSDESPEALLALAKSTAPLVKKTAYDQNPRDFLSSRTTALLRKGYEEKGIALQKMSWEERIEVVRSEAVEHTEVDVDVEEGYQTIRGVNASIDETEELLPPPRGNFFSRAWNSLPSVRFPKVSVPFNNPFASTEEHRPISDDSNTHQYN